MMPAKRPEKFRDNVVRVALRLESEIVLAQIAKEVDRSLRPFDTSLREARVTHGDNSGVAVQRTTSSANAAGGTKSLSRNRGAAQGCRASLASRFGGKGSSHCVGPIADGVPIAVLCRVLKLLCHPYCCWLRHPTADTPVVQTPQSLWTMVMQTHSQSHARVSCDCLSYHQVLTRWFSGSSLTRHSPIAVKAPSGVRPRDPLRTPYERALRVADVRACFLVGLGVFTLLTVWLAECASLRQG